MLPACSTPDPLKVLEDEKLTTVYEAHYERLESLFAGRRDLYLAEYGSAASRRPSPTKLKHSTASTMKSTGIISQG